MARVEVPFGGPFQVPDTESGKTYYVENAGKTPVYVDKRAAAPVDPDMDEGVELLHGNSWNRRVRDRELRPRGWANFKLATGESLYAWTYEFDTVLQVHEVG